MIGPPVHYCPDCDCYPCVCDDWRSAEPPYQPIDWNKENAWMFMNGAVRVQKMTREAFAQMYPKPTSPD